MNCRGVCLTMFRVMAIESDRFNTTHSHLFYYLLIISLQHLISVLHLDELFCLVERKKKTFIFCNYYMYYGISNYITQVNMLLTQPMSRMVYRHNKETKEDNPQGHIKNLLFALYSVSV